MPASRRVSPAERFRAQTAVPAAAITTSPPAIQRGVKCRPSGGLVSGSRWTAAPHGQLLLFGSIDEHAWYAAAQPGCCVGSPLVGKLPELLGSGKFAIPC